MITVYPRFSEMPVVPAADLLSLTSEINKRGNGRLGDAGGGKHAGMLVVRDSGTGDRYSVVMATGPAPADVWLLIDGTVKYTPV